MDRATTMGNQPFRPGTPYTGNFPDPTVLRVGNVFYVASTTVGSLSLPMMTSTQPAHVGAARRGHADRLPPRGRRRRPPSGGKVYWPTWAPSLAGVSPGHYVAAYAVPQAKDGRRCISVAQAGGALGPYVDRTTGAADLRDPRGHRPADLP